jgi:hypothetical protein
VRQKNERRPGIDPGLFLCPASRNPQVASSVSLMAASRWTQSRNSANITGMRADVSEQETLPRDTTMRTLFLNTAAFLTAAALASLVMIAPTVALADDLPQRVHDAAVARANILRSSLPMKINDSTTMTDVRVEGTELIYINEVTFTEIDPVEGAAFRDRTTKGMCADTEGARKIIGWGGAYGWEYRHAGTVVYRFDLKSC